MTLRLFGAGAIALAMLLVVLPIQPVAAKTYCYPVIKGAYVDPALRCFASKREAARDQRRHFPGEANREARDRRVRHAVDRERGDGGADVRSLVTAAAAAAGVPTHIAHAVVRVESGYRASLRGAAGEWGLGQIKCQTARGVGFAGACGGLADAATNLRYAMAYLATALRKGGAGCSGVSLYQTGTGRAPHCSGYGRRVMAAAGR